MSQVWQLKKQLQSNTEVCAFLQNIKSVAQHAAWLGNELENPRTVFDFLPCNSTAVSAEVSNCLKLSLRLDPSAGAGIAGGGR